MEKVSIGRSAHRGIELRPFRLADLANAALRDWDPEYERSYLGNAREQNPGWSAFLGDKFIGAGGIIMLCAGRAEGWLVATVWTEELAVGMACARLFRRSLDVVQRERKLIRIQAVVDVENDRALRFNHWLGFRDEGRLRKLFANGHDAIIMARIR